MFFDNGLPVDALTAQALYTGILTDTGQFRFHSTSRRCFVLAGELVARGAQPSVAGYELYERETEGKLRLLQHFLASLRLECDGERVHRQACDRDLRGHRNNAGGHRGPGRLRAQHRRRGDRRADRRAAGRNREGQPPREGAGLSASTWSRRSSTAAGMPARPGLNLKSGAENFYSRLVAALADRLDAVEAGEKV
jgi:phosphoesterase RecJ-like protein